MTVIKPQMSTVEIQADLLEKRHSGSTKSHRSETVSHNKIELSTISSSSSSISSPASSSKSHRSKTLKSISRDSILEERRLSQKSFDEQPNIPAPKSDTSDYYQLRESLQMVSRQKKSYHLISSIPDARKTHRKSGKTDSNGTGLFVAS